MYKSTNNYFRQILPSVTKLLKIHKKCKSCAGTPHLCRRSTISTIST